MISFSILALLLLVVIPNYPSIMKKMQFRAAAVKIMTAINHARVRSGRENQVYQLNLDLDGSRFNFGPVPVKKAGEEWEKDGADKDAIRLPEGVKFARLVKSDQTTYTAGRHRILFSPLGWSESFEISLSSEGINYGYRITSRIFGRAYLEKE